MTSDLDALAARSAAYTAEFTYVRGNYTIGTEALSYFSVAMRVDEAVRALVLPRDVVLDPRAPIRMEELFQRELDEKRAEAEIIPYLKASKQPKFFNALTVVVLPVDPDNERMLAHEYVDLGNRPPAPADDQFRMIEIGPVRIRELAANPSIGFASWDTRLARAVIVDGQHRFYALRELFQDENFPYRGDLGETAVPVLLLVLDKRAGFETANEQQTSVLQTCRALFIDLNKHAQKVTATRQYLLDDRDLSAVAMRRVMSDEIGGASGQPVKERVEETRQVPLALIDWSSEEARFDTGPYLSTVLTLYDIVQMTVKVGEPKANDYAAQRDYVAKLLARLELDDVEQFDESALRRDIDRAEERGLPFALSNAAVSAAASGFRDSLGIMIVRPLVELLPYAELIARYEQTSLVSGEYEQWMGLDRPGKYAYAEEVGVDPDETARDISEAVKPKYRLAYQVVFQKAFISALVEMDGYRSDILKLWGQPSDGSRGDLVDAWIGRFNSIFGESLAQNDVWAGAGISINDTIQWTQASQRAISGFVATALLAPISEWVVANRDEERVIGDAGEWLDDVWGPAGTSEAIEGLRRQSAPWKRMVQTYVKAQFRAREEERTPGDSDFLNHGARMLARLALALPDGTTA